MVLEKLLKLLADCGFFGLLDDPCTAPVELIDSSRLLTLLYIS